MTKHASKGGRQGTADKIWAVGLAGATCAGLVGVVGVRVAEDDGVVSFGKPRPRKLLCDRVDVVGLGVGIDPARTAH